MKNLCKWLSLLMLLCLLPIPARAETAPFRDGDKIVIYDPDSGKALSSSQSGNYNASVSVSITDGVLTGFSDTEIWQVSVREDGSWRLENGGLALSMAQSYSYLRLGETHDGWVAESAGEGRFHLRNTGRNQVLLMNPRRYLWSATASTSTTAGVTAFAIYVLPREEVEPVLDFPEGYRLYFGLLHGHSDLSDGAHSVEDTFLQASNMENLDFFAVTDHSHAFDKHLDAALTDDASSLSADWARGKAAAQAVTDGDFVGIFGFEMAWNQQQGHMSTFGTPGFLSREQDAYQGYATGMEAYYQALLDAPGSVSQFNHPGDLYGTFKSFSAYSPELDQRISLMELGETTEYFEKALAQGWHLAPTLSADFHAAGRTVVLADSLTEAGLLEALANRRVYATTDEDLQILFSLNGELMGSRVPRSQVGATVELTCQLYDPTDSGLGKLEVMAESGLVLETLELTGSHSKIVMQLPSGRDYYYLRLTQPDGDRAVTAPIWLDDRNRMGIASLETAASLTTAGEAQEILVTLFNDEPEPLSLSAITLTLDGQAYTQSILTTVPPFGTAVCAFTHTFQTDGVYSLRASAEGSYDGEPRRFSLTRKLTVMPPALVDDIWIDCAHGTGDTFQHIMDQAVRQDVDLQLLTDPLSREQVNTCRLLVIPAPAEAPDSGYLSLIQAHIQQGGSLLLCGTSPEDGEAALGYLNEILELTGASGRFLCETPWDPVQNREEPYQIRTAVFSDSFWLDGLENGQYFRQDGGTCIDPGEGQWLVKGLETAGSPVLLSVEPTEAGGHIFLSGCSFLSDAYLPLQTGVLWEQPSANLTIAENILGLIRSTQSVIPISQLRQAEPGRIYLAEGRVTAGTANPHTTFPDTIYIQDSTGGIAVSGYSTHGLPLGTRVRILGVLDWSENNPLLRLLRLVPLGNENPLLPRTAIPQQPEGGCLLQTEGIVTALTGQGSAVSRFTLTDGDTSVEVHIEDAIHSGSRGVNNLARIVREGNRLRAVGLCHLVNGSWGLRVRDCDEILLLAGTPSDSTLPTDPTQETPQETAPEEGTDSSPTGPEAPTDSPSESTTPEETVSYPTGVPEGPGLDPEQSSPVNPDTEDPVRIWMVLLFLSLAGLLILRKRA